MSVIHNPESVFSDEQMPEKREEIKEARVYNVDCSDGCAHTVVQINGTAYVFNGNPLKVVAIAKSLLSSCVDVYESRKAMAIRRIKDVAKNG